MAKVLLVDTNFSSGPIYQALLGAGHEVHVVGGNPQDCLAKAAGSYWRLDYSDTAALAALIDTEKFDFIVPGCTDRSYASCVTAGRGRFPGIDTPQAAEAISHKGRFREVAARIGLPVPRLFVSASAAVAAGRPVIVKPVDSYSGKGITVVRDTDPDAIAEAVTCARGVSPSGDYLLEEYVDGQLYSHSAFLRRKRIVEDFFVQEDGSANPFAVDTSRLVVGDFEPLRTELRRCIEALAEELDLVDGLIHTQFIADEERFKLIETTRRCPGDLYSQLIELSTGFPYADGYARSFLGGDGIPAGVDRPQLVMRHTITTRLNQSLGHVAFRRPVQIDRWVPLGLVGDELKPSPAGRVAVIFCRDSNAQSLEDLYQCALRRELYDVVDGFDTPKC